MTVPTEPAAEPPKSPAPAVPPPAPERPAPPRPTRAAPAFLFGLLALIVLLQVVILTTRPGPAPAADLSGLQGRSDEVQAQLRGLRDYFDERDARREELAKAADPQAARADQAAKAKLTETVAAAEKAAAGATTAAEKAEAGEALAAATAAKEAANEAKGAAVAAKDGLAAVKNAAEKAEAKAGESKAAADKVNVAVEGLGKSVADLSNKLDGAANDFTRRSALLNADVRKLELAVRGLADQARREGQASDVVVIVSHAAESDGAVGLKGAKEAVAGLARRTIYPHYRLGVVTESNGLIGKDRPLALSADGKPTEWKDVTLPARAVLAAKPGDIDLEDTFAAVKPPAADPKEKKDEPKTDDKKDEPKKAEPRERASRRCVFVVTPRCPAPDPAAAKWKGVVADVVLLDPTDGERADARKASEAWAQFARQSGGMAVVVRVPAEPEKVMTSDAAAKTLPSILRRLTAP